LLDAFIVFLGQDLAWAACTIFIFVAMLLGGDKPVQVVVPLILVSSLQVVALIASYTWKLYEAKKRGAIRLEDEDDRASLRSSL
jgi:cell division protein FtsW (lipid II flippase)